MTNETDYGSIQDPDSSYADFQDPSSEYANKFSGESGKRGKSKAAKKKPKIPVKGELTILGYFKWEPPIDGKTEIDYLLNGKWSPSLSDFMKIAGPTSECPSNFAAFLGTIAEYAPKSIKRLNFFTHSNQHTIGIMGTIDETNVFFTESIDETDIVKYAEEDFLFEFKKNPYSLDDVRGRFSDDAFAVLYGCKIGYDPTSLLTALRDLLHITCIGFKEKTVFCPPRQDPNGTIFIRKGEKLGIYKKDFKCDIDATSNWRSLINNADAVKISK